MRETPMLKSVFKFGCSNEYVKNQEDENNTFK
jgi:hypothetical protein